MRVSVSYLQRKIAKHIDAIHNDTTYIVTVPSMDLYHLNFGTLTKVSYR
jgi:hypothetical protein